MKKQEILNYLDEELMDKLFGYCYARTNDSYEAQELCSDIVYALVKTARIEGEVFNLHPFIWKVARNVYADFLKQKKQNQVTFYEGNPEEILALVSSDDEEDENRERLEAIYRQIAFLTKIYREVMIQFYLDGYSTAEIAKMQNTTETNVRQRLFWARGKVKKGVEDEDMEKAFERPLALDKMNFMIGAWGDPDWGDPRDVGIRTLSRHIIWLCRKKPMGAVEIAEKLNVPTFYVEEELEILTNGKNGEYGLLRREGKDRYIINFILLDVDTMKKAVQIYDKQMPKVSAIIADYVEKHRAEYLKFPYLNHCFKKGEPDFNLVLWQQMLVIGCSFRSNVNRLLEEKYFADYEGTERPLHVFGHVETNIPYSAGSSMICAENLCGFRRIEMINLWMQHVKGHFECRHNMSTDPQIQMALRAIDGMSLSELTDDDKEHAAKAVECGYLYREGDMLYTKILVCPKEEEKRLFAISEKLSEGHFKAEAEAVAEQIAALIKKAVPKHLLGEWRFVNVMAGMPSANQVEDELIKRGILIPPEDGIGAEGCWMSVN